MINLNSTEIVTYSVSLITIIVVGVLSVRDMMRDPWTGKMPRKVSKIKKGGAK